MADNLNVTPGSGKTIAMDEVADGTLGTVSVGFGKIMDGTLDSTNKLVVDSSGALSNNTTKVGGTAIDTNSGNKSSGTQRVVLATDQPALTNKLLVTPDSVALPAHQSVNVDQINGNTPLVVADNADSIAPTATTDKQAIVNRNMVFSATANTFNRQKAVEHGLNSSGVGHATAGILGEFDDVSPTSITENQFGTVRMSANRNLYGTIRDAAGNERGVNVTSGNALTVDASATTQPVSGSVTANIPADTAPATQNITAADIATTSTSQQNSQAAITGTPTANSAATFAVSSLDTVSVQITGTWVATLVVEFSVDGGTTYFTKALHANGTNYSVASATSNVTGTMNVSTATHVRIRATAYTSGTATVKLVGSVNNNSVYLANSPSIADGTTPSQKLAVNASGQISESNLPTTVDTNSGNKSASTLRVVLATDQPALTNKLLVTPDANSAINVSQVAGGTAINSGVTGAQAIGGDTASATTDAGNPVKVGGKYLATKPTFTDGQRGDLQIGTRGSAATSLFVADSTLAAKFNADNADAIAVSANSDKLTAISRGTVYNGTSWDRMPGDTTGVAIKDNGNSITVDAPVGTPVFVTPTPSTTGGWTYSKKAALSNTNSQVKSGAGTLGGYYIYNPNASVAYVQIYDTATGSITVGTTAAVLSIGIPATSAANLDSAAGINFATAICVAATTAAGNGTAPGTALDCNFWYK